MSADSAIQPAGLGEIDLRVVSDSASLVAEGEEKGEGIRCCPGKIRFGCRFHVATEEIFVLFLRHIERVTSTARTRGGDLRAADRDRVQIQSVNLEHDHSKAARTHAVIAHTESDAKIQRKA